MSLRMVSAIITPPGYVYVHTLIATLIIIIKYVKVPRENIQ